MKKRYTISLDGDETDRLKRFLRKRGISFSAFLNSKIREELTPGGIMKPGEGEELFLVLASGGRKTGKRRAKGIRSATLPGFK